MSIVWTDVVAVAPTLSTVPVATQTYILDAVNNRWVDDCAWGDFADDGRRYLAAHVATLSRNNSGIVTSESVGPLSRSYALPVGVRGSLGMSIYGMEYSRLLGLTPGSLGFVP